mmetsp:Transcript_51928/g.129240  ORF Transcript_51928/g.129240 Transcript_51928/m.129240 type:complete len:206 (+) Transcript_51928:2947-3564(+)
MGTAKVHCSGSRRFSRWKIPSASWLIPRKALFRAPNSDGRSGGWSRLVWTNTARLRGRFGYCACARPVPCWTASPCTSPRTTLRSPRSTPCRTPKSCSRRATTRLTSLLWHHPMLFRAPPTRTQRTFPSRPPTRRAGCPCTRPWTAYWVCSANTPSCQLSWLGRSRISISSFTIGTSRLSFSLSAPSSCLNSKLPLSRPKRRPNS